VLVNLTIRVVSFLSIYLVHRFLKRIDSFLIALLLYDDLMLSRKMILGLYKPLSQFSFVTLLHNSLISHYLPDIFIKTNKS
jgi:hypothetical protein